MKKVLFVCIENSCRSQMAEALFNAMAKDARAESAGTNPADRVDDIAIEVMKEVGIDISNKKPRVLTQEMNEKFDVIVTMGCIDACPITPKEKTIEWNIPDPKGKGVKEYRRVRDELKEKIEHLLQELNCGYEVPFSDR